MGKFKVGNIVECVGGSHIAAKEGATAIVMKEKDGYSGFVHVFWLDALAGAQMNGAYAESTFRLVSDTYRGYDANRVGTASMDPIVNLTNAASYARETGYEVMVTCTKTISL